MKKKKDKSNKGEEEKEAFGRSKKTLKSPFETCSEFMKNHIAY